jgi:hypothetical protein
MSSSYRSFTLNNPGDEEPWGDVEFQVLKDILDTLVLDTCVPTRSTSGGSVVGHKHYRMYKSDGSGVAVAVDAAGDLDMTYNATWLNDMYAQFGTALATAGISIGLDSDGNIGGGGSSAGVIESTGTGTDIRVKNPASGNIILESSAVNQTGGVMIRVKTSTYLPASQLSNSIMFYINGSDLMARYYNGSVNTTGVVATLS